MRALSLWQPWASLVAAGIKTIETRGWKTRIRGRFAVHAAKEPAREDYITELLGRAGLSRDQLPAQLPYGSIIATANLVDCVEVDAKHSRIISMTFRESVFGNFTLGRYAWLLADEKPLHLPIPCRGHQGWFNLPDDVALKLEAA